VVSEVRKIF